MLFLTILDGQVTNFINIIIPHNQFFDYFFSFFSLRGSSILIWLFVIVITLILEERKSPGIQKRDVVFIIVFLLSFSVSFVTSDLILKNVIKRVRPYHSNTTLATASVAKSLAQCPKNYSFPSSHAATAFAAAAVITAFDRKRKWLYYAVAVLISLSRIYLGCHYFFDILVGGVIGWTISKAVLHLLFLKRYRI